MSMISKRKHLGRGPTGHLDAPSEPDNYELNACLAHRDNLLEADQAEGEERHPHGLRRAFDRWCARPLCRLRHCLPTRTALSLAVSLPNNRRPVPIFSYALNEREYFDDCNDQPSLMPANSVSITRVQQDDWAPRFSGLS